MKRKIEYMDSLSVEELGELTETLVKVNRSAAVVKGGRRFSFSALSVVGDRKSVVGYGFGKARQVPNAIEKAAKDGRKHLQVVPVTDKGSFPHEVTGRFCGSVIRMIPASPGTGIIACSTVRAVCEMAGVTNILTKSYGSTNPVNLLKATLDALAQLRTREQCAELRGVQL
jgi:small subunit ribosomal protein S5